MNQHALMTHLHLLARGMATTSQNMKQRRRSFFFSPEFLAECNYPLHPCRHYLEAAPDAERGGAVAGGRSTVGRVGAGW